VTALQGNDVLGGVPANGEVLTWDNGNSRWAPAAPAATVVAKAAAYSAGYEEIVLADTGLGPFAVTLPTAVGHDGARVTVKKTSPDANVITVDGTAGQLIDGAAAQTWTQQWRSLSAVAYGGAWYVY